jgi:hypothetical protein
MSQQATPELKDTVVNTDKVPELNINDATRSQSELTRNVIEELGTQVRLVDKDEDNKLDLFCYVKCTNTDTDLIKRCRGVVFNKDKIVINAFPYTAEYNHTESLNTILGDFSKYSFYDAYEGALVRTFYFNGKWFLSTHRKINAFKSKWSSRDSFGTHFKRALDKEELLNKKFSERLPLDGDNILDRFYTILDKTKQYMFLILNSDDNRIVCQSPSEKQPNVYHVGTFSDGKLSMDEDISLPTPYKHTFLNIDELYNYVSKIDYNLLQGVICFSSDNTQIKIINKVYQDLFRVRGNVPSIKFRYLQVRMNKKFTDMLYYLYPYMEDIFNDYENTLYDIAMGIFNAYILRYMKKKHTIVPQEEFQVLKECHNWYMEDRNERRVTLECVIRAMNTQSPTALNHMIRRFKTELKKGDESFPRNCKDTRSSHNSPSIVALRGTPVLSPLLLGKCAIPSIHLLNV